MRRHTFGRDDVEIEASETVYQGFFKMLRYSVRHRLFNGGWSRLLKRELFQRGDAVGILIFDPGNNTLGLVEQFRIGALQHAHGPWQYEVVAGMVESGAAPSDVAMRELQEETGLEIDSLVPVCDYLVSAGGSDEKMYLYCALTDLSGCGGIFGLPSEAEDISFQVWSYEQVAAAFDAGQMNSAAMTISWLWLEKNRPQLYRDYVAASAAS
ncbi:MAG: NUDIX domain-containing protein [Porticoccaceae bacterium]|nr:NUDIX domain-containing protein [Porticoccaceae bacterium]